MYNNGKTVLGEKRFAYHELVLELAIGLWESQNSINHKDLLGRPPCKNETNEVYDLELYSGITSNCKPPQNIDFIETELSFKFVWFDVSMGLLFSMGRWNLLPLFCLICS